MTVYRSIVHPISESTRAISRPIPGNVYGSSGGASFVATPSTETPVAGVDVTWSTNAGDLGTPVSYYWDFGDGTVPGSGASIPPHYYVGLGPYTSTFIVTYDDDSTDTDTQVITPSAPSAVSGQTELGYETFASTSAASPGDFDYFNVVASAFNPGISSGAKKAAASGVGWSGRITTSKAYGRWTTGSFYDQSPYGGAPYPIYYQVGCWFKFPSLPTAPIMLAGWTHREFTPSGSLADGIQLDTDGTLFTTVGGLLGKTIPLDTWFWVGVNAGSYQAGNGGNVHGKFMYKEVGSAIEVLESDILFGGGVMYYATLDATVGAFSIDNLDNTCKMTGATLHTMLNLTDGAYPEEIIPPQEVNYIYRINPDTGSDSNDGVTAPWQTVSQANAQMAATRGLDATHTTNTAGSGPWLMVDTSTADLDVGTTGLILKTNGIWLKPHEDQDHIQVRAYVEVDAGDWSATGGYDDIYETACTVPVQTTVFGDNVCFEPVASLAALDAAAGGASFVDTTADKLYIKTLALTNPSSDGITYIYGRIRPESEVDTVGLPAVCADAASVRISDCVIWYTAVNNNGSYAIGDGDLFAETLTVERCSNRYGDKHGFCFVKNATNTTINIIDCYSGYCWSYPFTSFMATGSGNVHNYIRCTSDVDYLLERTSTGAPVATHGNGPGTFYSHGAGGVFAEVNFIDCQFAGSVTAEYAATLLTADADCSFQYISSLDEVELTGTTFRDVIDMNGGGIADGLIVVTGNEFVVPRVLQGTLSDSNFDLRTLGECPALWSLGGATTFTGNTVRYSAGNSSPIIKDSAAADITAWNNNTYYIEANAIFAKNFDSGSGPEDLDWAGWQGKGFDLDSDRFDPV